MIGFGQPGQPCDQITPVATERGRDTDVSCRPFARPRASAAL